MSLALESKVPEVGDAEVRFFVFVTERTIAKSGWSFGGISLIGRRATVEGRRYALPQDYGTLKIR